MLPQVVGSSPRVPQPPLHGRRAKPSVRRVVGAGGATGGWNERPAWAHQMVSHPREATGLKRCQRSINAPAGRPAFTLQTQVNLRRPTDPRPYRQKQAIPQPMPLSDTVVLANLDARKVHVAPPKFVQTAIDSWQVVWNTPRVHARQQKRIAALHNEMDAFDAKLRAQAEAREEQARQSGAQTERAASSASKGSAVQGAQTER